MGTERDIIPTPADLTSKAASFGTPLVFEYEDQRDEKVWVLSDEVDVREYVTVREYVAYADDIDYGIYALISEDPQLLTHRFYVIFAVDAQETNGKAYERLDDALRYMKHLIYEA